jgi:DNA-binding NarL/FixJ family response regulator
MNYQTPITIAMADDHSVYRDGLKLTLDSEPAFRTVGEASNGAEVIELCRQANPDIILMDISMPVIDGIEATKRIHVDFPGTGIIGLTMYDQERLIVEMLEAGASGYLLKNADKSQILEAVKQVYQGIPFYCRSTSVKLAKLISQSKFNPYTQQAAKVVFTAKEIEIVKMICEGLNSDEIGEKLFLSGRTIHGIRRVILNKMNVKSTAAMILYAIKNNLVDVNSIPDHSI